MLDLTTLTVTVTVTCAAAAAVLGAGLSVRARLAQRHWWSVDAMGNAVFFAVSLVALELVTIFAALGILTGGGE